MVLGALIIVKLEAVGTTDSGKCLENSRKSSFPNPETIKSYSPGRPIELFQSKVKEPFGFVVVLKSNTVSSNGLSRWILIG